MAIRKFSAEGALHLYSSAANPLFPSELYLAKKHPGIRSALELCNIYLITCRRRIGVDPLSLSIRDGWLLGQFVVVGESGWERVPFRYALPHHEEELRSASVSAEMGGSYVVVTNSLGQAINIPSHVIVAQSDADLGDS